MNWGNTQLWERILWEREREREREREDLLRCTSPHAETHTGIPTAKLQAEEGKWEKQRIAAKGQMRRGNIYRLSSQFQRLLNLQKMFFPFPFALFLSSSVLLPLGVQMSDSGNGSSLSSSLSSLYKACCMLQKQRHSAPPPYATVCPPSPPWVTDAECRWRREEVGGEMMEIGCRVGGNS